jgi:Na+/H+ antiporter NhaD/arsenite permease-like protein
LKPLVWAYVVGSTIGSILLAIGAYWLSLSMIVAHRRHAAHRQHQPLQ